MHLGSTGRVNSRQSHAEIKHSQKDMLSRFIVLWWPHCGFNKKIDKARINGKKYCPEMGRWHLQVDRTDSTHLTSEKPQWLTPPETRLLYSPQGQGRKGSADPRVKSWPCWNPQRSLHDPWICKHLHNKHLPLLELQKDHKWLQLLSPGYLHHHGEEEPCLSIRQVTG